MSPTRVRPAIHIPTNSEVPYGPNSSIEDLPLSSLSPASLSTTLSSAPGYYSTPHHEDEMDMSEDEAISPVQDIVRIKTEDSSTMPITDIRGFADSPPLVSLGLPVKRKPGRPAKIKSASKESRKPKTNERSKTGCLTCRKRKKKCDETKPMCLNCSKTNYRCEGYPERRDWAPSSSRLKRQNSSSEGMTAPPALVSHVDCQHEDVKPQIVLPPQPRLRLFPAIEDQLDSLLLEHFTEVTSRVLTIHTSPEDNPWITLILPMAKESSCLMHSVLDLSGVHLARSDESRSGMSRQYEHAEQAFKVLQTKISTVQQEGGQLERPIVAALIINCLNLICAGSTDGSYTWHLGPLKDYVQDDGTEFGRFAWEFYKQYEFSKTLTSLPKDGQRRDFHLEYFERTERRPSQPASPTNGLYLTSTSIRVGVLNDAFLRLISEITHLRDRVRARQAAGQRPAVDPLTFNSAERLDNALWKWESGHGKDTSHGVAAELYRHACLCYLLRTIRGARNLKDYADRFEYGKQCLEVLPEGDAVWSQVLLPTFLLGCAAFEADQRVFIENTLDKLEQYSHMGNIKPAQEVLKKVWELMDKEDERNWDWETIMQNMGYDILII